jgi:hypothetical protein
MRFFWLGLLVLCVSCVLAGCEGGSGESTATPANPQAGLDAVKKLQDLPKVEKSGGAPSAGPQGEKK